MQLWWREHDTILDSERKLVTFVCLCFVVFVCLYFTSVLSHWELCHGKFGPLSPGKANCDRVALFNLRFMLDVWCFRNPLKSGVDCRIFNVCMWSFCKPIHSGPRFFFSLIRETFVGYRTALNFDSRESRPQSSRKDKHEKVTHPCGDHAWSCLTTAFESESSRCVLPTCPLSGMGGPAYWCHAYGKLQADHQVRLRLLVETDRVV